MATDYVGTKNEPQFDGTKPPSSSAADLNTIVEFALYVGNRKVGTASQRAAVVAAEMWEGLDWYETDTKITYRVVGGAWIGWASPWITYTAYTNWGSTGASNVFLFRYENGDIHVRGRSTIQSGFSIPSVMVITGPQNISAPAGSQLGTASFRDVSAGVSYQGVALFNTSNQVNLFALNATGTSVVQESEGSTVPLPWAIGDFVDVDFLYTHA